VNKTKLGLILLLSNLPLANAITLDIGIAVTEENNSHLAETSWEYAKSSTTQEKFNDGFADAFYRESGSTDLFSISSSLHLYLTNFETREVLGNWPLKRPASFKLFPEITTQYKDLNVEIDTNSYEYSEWLEGVGCMNKLPLRYGDFNGDANNEVVLFLDNDLVLFSPNAKKVIFSMPIDSSDWLTEAESITVGKDVYGTPKHKYISQYLSQNNTLGAGHRIYGKLFMADFDDNDKSNIITWHKIYESPLLTSDQQGFIKVRDEYQLFEMADSGEYKVKAIEASEIKNLLVDASLTWQKGYPSISECAGQEGKLIPEMHDPLLNDPDVLK
jgi:hypothetical protein